MRSRWLPVSEFLGTFAVVFVAAGALVAVTARPLGGDPLLTVAVAYGAVFGLMMVAFSTDDRPAHLNPAVTLGALVTGRIDLRRAAVAILAQVTGAAAGAAVLRVALPAASTERAVLGAVQVDPTLSSGQAVLIEAVLTAVLVWTVVVLVERDRGAGAAGLAAGLAVTFAVLAAGPFTGGALNPARAFGPALVEGAFAAQWVYWVGPIAGGVVGAVGADVAASARR